MYFLSSAENNSIYRCSDYHHGLGVRVIGKLLVRVPVRVPFGPVFLICYIKTVMESHVGYHWALSGT